VTAIAIKVTRSVTSSIALLRCIDSRAGSLNDNGIDKYTQIEAASSINQFSLGQSIMQKHWKFTKVRNIAKDFPSHMFCII